jgi:hypothetical protein
MQSLTTADVRAIAMHHRTASAPAGAACISSNFHQVQYNMDKLIEQSNEFFPLLLV